MHKKKRKVAADESFEHGPIRMMRFGKINVIQNRMNPEQHKAFMSRLAVRHPKVCQEIDELVQRIADAVALFNPLPLLLRAYWEYLPSAMGIASEIEIGKEGIEKRFIIEYLQSMICAVTPQETQKEQPTDEEWALLTTDICNLLNKLTSEYFLTHSAWAKSNDPNYDERREEFSVQAQMHWVLAHGKFRHITRCCITLDQLTEFAARAENLHEIGVNVGKTPVWTISIDDLRVFADIIDNPLVFCHFLEERARAFLSPALQTDDELDHLALYLAHNHYSKYAEDFGFDTPVGWHGYRESLDRFFASKVGGEHIEQPGQPIPSRLKEIICSLSSTQISGRCKAAAWLLDMGGSFRDQSNELINQTLDEQEQAGRPKPVTCIGDIPVTFYCSIDGVIKHDNHLVQMHTLATLSLSHEPERLALKLDYSPDKKLHAVTPIFFSAKDVSAVKASELNDYAQRMVENRFNTRLMKGGKRKIGRNEFCPCGSRKKYKKCCGLSGAK